MSSDHPEHGSVYRWSGGDARTIPEGTPGVYVRTEVRPGSDGPSHLLVTVRDRTIRELWESPEDFGSRWDLASAPTPEAVELAESRRERVALAETLSAVEGVVVEALANGTDGVKRMVLPDAAKVGKHVRGRLVERFRLARDRVRVQ